MPIFREQDFALNGDVPEHIEAEPTLADYDERQWAIREHHESASRFLATAIPTSDIAYDLVVARQDRASAEGETADLTVIWPGHLKPAIEYERTMHAKKEGTISNSQLARRLDELGVPSFLVPLLLQDIHTHERPKYFKDIESSVQTED